MKFIGEENNYTYLLIGENTINFFKKQIERVKFNTIGDGNLLVDLVVFYFPRKMEEGEKMCRLYGRMIDFYFPMGDYWC